MNKELYESIKQELVALPEYLAAPELVRSKLIEYLEGKNQVDYFTTLYAFYEYMNNNDDFSFIKTGQWADFFKQAFDSCFTDDSINNYLETLATMPEVLNVVLTECSSNIKEKIYDAFKNSDKLEDYNYKKAFDTIEDKLGYKYEPEKEQTSFEEPSLDDFLHQYNKDVSPVVEEPNLDEILSKYNEEVQEITEPESSYENFASSFNNESLKEDEAVPIEPESNVVEDATPIEVEQVSAEPTVPIEVEPAVIDATVVEPEPQVVENHTSESVDDKPIIVNDISLEEKPVALETYTDKEIIPDIGLNKEVTESVEQAYTPSFVASNNIVQSVGKEAFDKLKSRILESRTTKPYELENNISKALNGSVSSDRIATVDKGSLLDILNATLVNKVLTNIVPQWQQNGILSKISARYIDDDTRVKTMV